MYVICLQHDVHSSGIQMLMYNTLFLSTIDTLHVQVDNVCKHSCSPFVDKKKTPYICKGIPA